MTPFEAYRDYLAVVRHFTSDYDYAKYNGKVRVLRRTWEARSDQYWFEKIASHHDPHWLIVANLVDDPRRWIGDVAKGTELYAVHKGRVDALEYTFSRDLEKVGHDPMVEIGVCGQGHPGLARRCLAGEICVETGSVVSRVTGCGSLWRQMADPLLRELGTRLDKYATFLDIPERASLLLREHFGG